MFYYASSFILLLIIAGLVYRRQTKIHVPLMIAAFVLDLSLVLVIEFQRHAVEKVVETASQGTDWFLVFHAVISLIVLVLYVLLMKSGFKILKLKKAAANFSVERFEHRNLAAAFLVLRLVNYVTSFYV